MEADLAVPGRGAPHAVAWSAIAYASRVGTQLLTVTLLSRFLSPDDFGIMAMAVVVTGLATVVRDLGAGPAVVRAADLSPTFLASQFWLAVAFGIVLAIAILIVAPLGAALFGEPEVAPLLAILAVGFVIGGVGVVPQALMERSYRFKPIALAEVAAGAASLGVAMVAAAANVGAFSLGLQSVVQTSVVTVAVFAMARWRPSARPVRAEVRRGLRFGAPLAGFSTLNYLVRNADNFLIGVTLGPGPLGYYSVAYRLMLLPVQVVTSVGNRVLLPMLSRLEGEPGRRRATFLAAAGAASLIGFPIAAGLAGAAEQIVAVLLGPGWEPTVPVLRILGLVALAQVVGAMVGPVMIATGRTDRLFAWGVVSAVITIAAFLVGLPFGIVGVAVAYAVASLGLFLPSLRVGLQPIGQPLRPVMQRVAPALLAAILGGSAIAVVGAVFSAMPSTLVLAIQVALLLLIYGLGVWAFDRPAMREARRMVVELAR